MYLCSYRGNKIREVCELGNFPSTVVWSDCFSGTETLFPIVQSAMSNSLGQWILYPYIIRHYHMEVWTGDLNFSDMCLHKIRCLLNKIQISVGHMVACFFWTSLGPGGVLSRDFKFSSLQRKSSQTFCSQSFLALRSCRWDNSRLVWSFLKVFTSLVSTLKLWNCMS